MKRILFVLLLLLQVVKSFAQPAGYTPGAVTDWVVNGRHYAIIKPAGWNFSDNHSYVMWFFGGVGQVSTNYASLTTVAPISMVSQGWNATTSVPVFGTVKWCIILAPNLGTNHSQYSSDMTYIMNNIGLSAGDTANHTKFIVGGLSLGVSTMWDYLKNWGSHNNPYRKIWGVTFSMSGTYVTKDADFTAIASNKKHYCYYGNPAGDGNSGTPFDATNFLFGDLPGTANVDKFFKVNATGTHGNSTWGDVSVPLSCFYPGGTDSSTNRLIWAVQAFGDPTNGILPVANAGVDQVVVLPATPTLNGSGSSDADNGIASYLWSKISGPSGGTITSTTSVTTTITSLVQGVYTYKLVVTDNTGASAADTVVITAANGAPSSNVIRINIGNNFFPWTGKESPQLLFDGLTDKKMDQDGIISFASPMKYYVELKDSAYENIKLRFYNGSGATQTWTVTFHDSTRALLGSYAIGSANLPYNGWVTMPGSPDTIVKPVRYIFFTCTNAATDVREIEISGDPVTKNSTILPAVITTSTFPDPGYKFAGNSALGDKDTTYMKLASGLPLAGSFRAPVSTFVWNHTQSDPWGQQRIILDDYGDMEKRMLRFHKAYNTETMLYNNGASIKVRPDLVGNEGYTPLTVLNQYKDIPVGSDSTDPANFALNTARTFKALSALWGNNTSANLGSSYTITGSGNPVLAMGQGKVQVMEIGNEMDKDWFGNTGYHSPEVFWAFMRASYDSVKSIDPLMKVHIGALYNADTTFWKAIASIHFWKTGNLNTPCNGFNYNMYQNTRYGGQSQGASGVTAVSPEQFDVTGRLEEMKQFRDRWYPGREMRWTEMGFSNAADYKVIEVPGIPDSIGIANFSLRTLERAAVVLYGVNVVYNYFHTSDGTGVFAGMKMVQELFDPIMNNYLGSRKLPLWWWWATRMNTLYAYKAWSQMIQDGDSTGVTITRHDHNTDPNKKVYYVVRGTYEGGVTNNQVVNVGNAQSATLVTMQYGSETGVQTPLMVTGNNVIVSQVTEHPQYIIVQLKADIQPSVFKRRGVRFKLKR